MVRKESFCRHKKPSPSTRIFPSPFCNCKCPGRIRRAVQRVINAFRRVTTICGLPFVSNVSSLSCLMTSSPPASGCASAPDNRDFICCWCGGSIIFHRGEIARVAGRIRCARPSAAAKHKASATNARLAVDGQQSTASSDDRFSCHLSHVTCHFSINGDDRIPFSLRLQNHFHHLAHRAASARRARDEIRRRLHLRPRVGHRHANPPAPAAPNPPRRRRQNKPRSNPVFPAPAIFPPRRSCSVCRLAGRENQFSIPSRAACVAADGRAETQPTFKPARRARTRPRPSRMLNRLNSRSPPMNTEPSVSTPSTSHRNNLMRLSRARSCGEFWRA